MNLSTVKWAQWDKTQSRDCSFVCALHCAQLLHTILHRTDLIISPLTLQTITSNHMSRRKIPAKMLHMWSRQKWDPSSLTRVAKANNEALITITTSDNKASITPTIYHGQRLPRAACVRTQTPGYHASAVVGSTWCWTVDCHSSQPTYYVHNMVQQIRTDYTKQKKQRLPHVRVE